MKVAVVDDDLWVRLGRADALRHEPDFEVIEMTPRDAIHFGKGWADIEVALVDAHDESEPFDHFPGVRVVETIRANQVKFETLVIVISGHCDNQFLQLRMAEAGADYFYRHEEVCDLSQLVSTIREPDPKHRVTPPEPTVLAKLGLGTASRPNAALHYLEDQGLVNEFDAQRSQKTLQISRRSIMRVRREIARIAALSSIKPVGPSRNLDAPEWRAVVDFVNRARGVERRVAPERPGVRDHTD